MFVRVPEAVSQSTSGYSNYLFVNAAEPWSTLDLAGTEANGSAPFRLFGWNLSVPSATPSVRLLDPSTGSYIPVPNVAKTPNPYTLQVSLSGIANLVDGQAYRVFVSNGLVPNATSVSNGEVEGPTLFYTTLGAANRRALHVIRWPPAPPTSQLLKCPTLMIIGGTGSPHGSHLRSQSPSNALRAVSSGRKSDRSALEKRRKPWCS